MNLTPQFDAGSKDRSGDEEEPCVLVYRRRLLKFSETFILRQIGSMTRWRPILIGEPIESGLSLEAVDWIRVKLPKPRRINAFLFFLYRLRRRLFGRKAILPAKSFCRALKTADLLRRAPWFAGLQASKPALLHVHFGTNAEEAWPLAIALDVPILITLHGYDAATYKHWWEDGDGGRSYVNYPAVLREMEQHGARFVAVSDAILESAVEYGLNATSIKKVLIGIDTSTIKPYNLLEIVKRPPRILFVGRSVEKKGLEYLLTAFQAVRASLPNAELRIVGEMEHNRSLGDCMNIQFVGKLPSDDVLREMGNARVLCVPSVRAFNGDSEGLPTVIYEAQALGLPVVTSARGGTSEGIIHGVTGFEFPERDTQALATCLLQILREDELARRMSIAARDFAERKLDHIAHTLSLEEEYNESVRLHLQKQTGPVKS